MADKLSRDDPAYYNKLGRLGGLQHTRGYLGYLKQTGQHKKLADMAKKAADGRAKAKALRAAGEGKTLLRGLAEAKETQKNNKPNQD